MKRLVVAVLATAIAASALTGATATPALAASTGDPAVGQGSSLAAIQRAGAIATSRRIAALSVAETRVDGSKYLSDAHRATLLDTLRADSAAMSQIAADIAGATTASDALVDYRTIFTDYRVYAVALPQSLYTAGADALTDAVLPRLHRAHDNLAARASTPELQARLADMANEIAAAESGSATLAADALAVTPSSWAADNGVLADIRQQLRDASAHAREAARMSREIAEALR